MSDSEGEVILPVKENEKKSFAGKLRKLVNNLIPKRNTRKFELDTTDSVLVLFFTAIGMLTRIFRIQSPNTAVFDEVHFGNFTNWYLRGQYFHDIHPPLGKLIMAAVASFAGYQGEYQFEQLTDKKYPTMTYVALRVTPAFFGALCVPLSYLTARAMGCRHFASFVAGILTASELMLIVEARFILSDSILHFFSCLSVFSIYLHDRVENWVTFFFQCICLGLVASCKYTSGGIVVLALVKQFLMKDSKRFALIRCMIIVFFVGIIHFSVFAIHLSALPYIPENHVSMPYSINQSLVVKMNPDWEQRNKAPPMILRIISLIIYMFYTNALVGYSHPYASPWYSWPLFNSHWVLFWTSEGKHVICMGNVLLWYPVFIGVIGNIIRKLFNSCDGESFEILLGYLFSYLPFALVPRDCFLYHYAIPILFGIWGLVLFIERQLSATVRGFMFCLVSSMAVFGYFLWCPWAYALTTPDFNFMVWNNKWR